jgi:hypothetical protein
VTFRAFCPQVARQISRAEDGRPLFAQDIRFGQLFADAELAATEMATLSQCGVLLESFL